MQCATCPTDRIARSVPPHPEDSSPLLSRIKNDHYLGNVKKACCACLFFLLAFPSPPPLSQCPSPSAAASFPSPSFPEPRSLHHGPCIQRKSSGRADGTYLGRSVATLPWEHANQKKHPPPLSLLFFFFSLPFLSRGILPPLSQRAPLSRTGGSNALRLLSVRIA